MPNHSIKVNRNSKHSIKVKEWAWPNKFGQLVKEHIRNKSTLVQLTVSMDLSFRTMMMAIRDKATGAQILTFFLCHASCAEPQRKTHGWNQEENTRLKREQWRIWPHIWDWEIVRCKFTRGNKKKMDVWLC